MPSYPTELDSEDYLDVLKWISRNQARDRSWQESIFRKQQAFKLERPRFFKDEVRDRVFLEAKEIYEVVRERRLKHKFKINLGDSVEYINDNPVLSLNWHFYKKALKSCDKEYLIGKFQLDERIYSQEEVATLTQSAFRAGIDDYTYLMGLDTLWGWVPFRDDEEILKKLKAWVNNNNRPNFNGSEEDFYIRFRANIRRVLRWRTEKKKMTVSASDFCANIASTGTPGSAFDPHGPKIQVDVDGRRVDGINNKFAKSAALSAEQKLERLFRLERQKANASVKVEFFPKVRLIISADYNITMRMRFIDEWLTPWLRGLDISTLFMRKDQLLKMWRDFLSKKGVNVPVDQKEFDHHTTKRMVRVCLEEIRALIDDMAEDNEELLRVMDAIIYSLDGGKVYYRDHNNHIHEFDYESGVLSGWQWTALLDSLCNAGELLTAIDLCTSYGIRINILQLNVQGDDVALKTESYLMGFALLTAMRSMSFIIHPKKSFISTHHNEYLRRYAMGDMVNGYPARMVNNILWLYPGDKFVKDPLTRLNSMRDVWVKFYERLQGGKEFILSSLKQDVVGAKIPWELWHPYLQTARSFGGGGVIDRKTDVLIAPSGESRSHFVIHNDPGYIDFRLRFGDNQGREMERWFLQVIGATEFADKTDAFSIRPADHIKPLPYQFLPSQESPKCSRNPRFPANVIFGQSHEFLVEAFPRIDTFTEQANAPKSWVYDYVTGRVKMPAPPVDGMSDEFASLAFDSYAPSLVNAMYYKRSTEDKWLRLLLYTELYFSAHYRTMVFDTGRYY